MAINVKKYLKTSVSKNPRMQLGMLGILETILRAVNDSAEFSETQLEIFYESVEQLYEKKDADVPAECMRISTWVNTCR